MLNQTLFELLSQKHDDARDELWLPLRRSFTDEDGNVAMHVHALRHFFIRSDNTAYLDAVAVAKRLNLSRRDSDRPRFQYANPSNSSGRFRGTVTSFGDAFGFVSTGMLNDAFFSPGSFADLDDWDQIQRGRTLTFDLYFNVKGPVALNIQLA